MKIYQIYSKKFSNILCENVLTQNYPNLDNNEDHNVRISEE